MICLAPVVHARDVEALHPDPDAKEFRRDRKANSTTVCSRHPSLSSVHVLMAINTQTLCFWTTPRCHLGHPGDWFMFCLSSRSPPYYSALGASSQLCVGCIIAIGFILDICFLSLMLTAVAIAYLTASQVVELLL
jgi:hypothetical protein